MKTRFLLFAALIFTSTIAMAIPASAAKTLDVEFQYDQPAASYNLYMDGNKLCSAAAGTEKKLSCVEMDINYGVHLFTMTAVNGSGMETKHSPAFVWPYSPDQGDGPIMINFSVTVDGRVIKLGPVN